MNEIRPAPALDDAVLLVDGDIVSRHVIAGYLRHCGYRVVEAFAMSEQAAICRASNWPAGSGDTVPASRSGWRSVPKGPPGRLRACARSAHIFTDPMSPNPWLMKSEA